jgi:hypothetical protein
MQVFKIEKGQTIVNAANSVTYRNEVNRANIDENIAAVGAYS